MTSPHLALYRIPGCPYCILVEREIDRLGIDVEIRDITRDPASLRELLDARGRRTTPVLRIDDGQRITFMPESRDIVAWLRQRAP
jgi:glutaredoxin